MARVQDQRINGWSGYVAAPHCAPGSATGWAGDEAALCAPAPDEGIQLHYGPVDHDDPDEVQKFVLPPGGDTMECWFDSAPTESGKYFGQYVSRSRPGAHHLQLTYAPNGDATPAKTLRTCGIADLAGTLGTFMAIAQSPELDVPDLSISRPEGAADLGGLDFEGSAAPVDPGRMLELFSHFLNTTDESILKEAWFNLYFRDEAEVKSALHGISLIGGGINVAPGTTANVRRSCDTDVPRTVKYLQGHSHAGQKRFTIWRAPAGQGAGERLYESYDPLEPANLAYTPFVTNPAPDGATRRPGGASGPLVFQPGDSLVWECEFRNDSSSPFLDGGPSTDPGTGGQMCYTFGLVAVPVGDPAGNWICGANAPTTL